MNIDVSYNFQKETEPLDADRYSSKMQEYQNSTTNIYHIIPHQSNF